MNPAPAVLAASTSNATAKWPDVAVNLPPLGALSPVPGVRIGTACAGIKQCARDDIALIELAEGATAGAVFTQNRFRAPPVELAEARLGRHAPRLLLINSGNANAATGQAGLKDAETLSQHAAQSSGKGIEPRQVLPFSTGVIGERLPVADMRCAIDEATRALTANGWTNAAQAILTTDTGPKGLSKQIQVADKTVTLTGIAKGAGMIKPDMATMLAFICCDARVTQGALQGIVRSAAERSFNRITVDGDTSTNDAFLIGATAAADHPLIDGPGAHFDALLNGVSEIAAGLAERIVRDAEGATKFVTVQVAGGATQAECLQVAYAVAESPLVKTALFAGDPNWGRFCMAIGRAGITDLDAAKVSLTLDDVTVAEAGLLARDYDEAAAAAVMATPEFTVGINLHRGPCERSVWTSDLSYEYVRINAEYRT